MSEATIEIGQRVIYRAGRTEVRGVAQRVDHTNVMSFPPVDADGNRISSSDGTIRHFVPVWNPQTSVRFLADDGRTLLAEADLVFPEDSE